MTWFEDTPEFRKALDEERAALLEDVAETTCPGCGQQALRIQWRLKAKPLGSFSLSGQSMKVSASEVPWLVCGNCGIEAKGKQ